MRAMDVMTPDVITVDPDASVQAVAKLLSERGISGVPVVDAADQLVGIVSEGDLLHRVETGTERRPERLTGNGTRVGSIRLLRTRSSPATTPIRMGARQGRHDA